MFQPPLTLILPHKDYDVNERHIVIRIGDAYTTFSQEECMLLQSIAIDMGGVSAHLSNVLRSGFDFILP